MSPSKGVKKVVSILPEKDNLFHPTRSADAYNLHFPLSLVYHVFLQNSPKVEIHFYVKSSAIMRNSIMYKIKTVRQDCFLRRTHDS